LTEERFLEQVWNLLMLGRFHDGGIIGVPEREFLIILFQKGGIKGWPFDPRV